MLRYRAVVSLAQFLVLCLKWVKYDIVFNVFQRRQFSIRPNVCCVRGVGSAPLDTPLKCSTPAFSTPTTWCHVFYSHVFHPCYMVPRFPLPRFQRPPPVMQCVRFYYKFPLFIDRHVVVSSIERPKAGKEIVSQKGQAAYLKFLALHYL